MVDGTSNIPPAAYGVTFPLACVAGYVDAAGFLVLAGLFVAHMSGNTIRLGVFLGDGDWSRAAQRAIPLLVYVFGLVLGVALIEAFSRRRAALPAARVLAIETFVLLSFMLVGEGLIGNGSARGGSWQYYLLATLAVLAMSLQTAGLRKVAGVPLHTTFVTGVLTHIAEESVAVWYAWRDRRGGDERADPAVPLLRVRLHLAVWIGYLAGGVLGALVTLRWNLWSLSLPLVALGVLLALALRQRVDVPAAGTEGAE